MPLVISGGIVLSQFASISKARNEMCSSAKIFILDDVTERINETCFGTLDLLDS